MERSIVGVTADLARRVAEHRADAVAGFARRYRVHTLVFVEFHATIADAILREKRIKRWRREWKLEAIERQNPGWSDLADDLALSPPSWVPACAGTTDRLGREMRECRSPRRGREQGEGAGPH